MAAEQSDEEKSVPSDSEDESGRSSTSRQGTLTSVIAIHGVGNPRVGVIRKEVATTLERAGIHTEQVEEFNWNKLIDHPVPDRDLSFESFRQLALQLAEACAICVDPHESRSPRRSAGVFRRVVSAFLGFGELALVVIVGAYILLGPLLIALSLMLARENSDSWLHLAMVHRISALAALVFLISVIGASTVGTVQALVYRDTAFALIAVRRAAILVLRPLFMIGLTAFLIPWGTLFRRSLSMLRHIWLLPILALIVAAVGAVLTFIYAPEDLNVVLREVALAVGWLVVVAICTLGLLGLFAVTVTNGVGPLLKVVLDIVRYIGDEDYRHAIQEELTEDVARINPTKRIVLVGHSLGSVIALHSLCSSPCWQGRDVLLVTLGSPIRRSFCSFFPGLFFPRAVDSAARLVAARCSRFAWVNCYRPLDQIGTRLGLVAPFSIDVNTGQWCRVWNAHPDYWNDDRVVAGVRMGLRTVEPNVQHPSDYGSNYLGSTRREDVGYRSLIANIGLRVLLAALLILPILALSFQFKENVSISRTLKRQVEGLTAQRNHARASVTHWREMDTPPTAQTVGSYTDHFVFEYAVNGEPYSELLKDSSFGTFERSSYLVDSAALVELVRDHCKDIQGTTRPFASLSRKCKRDNLILVYDPRDPAFFVVPGAESRRGWWDAISDGALQIGVTLLITWVLVLGLALGAGTWLLPLLGLDSPARPMTWS